MSNVSQDKLLDVVESRYALVVLAAKRARQIRENAPAMVDSESNNPLTIALEEIAAGKVTYSVADHDEPTTGLVEEPEFLGLPTVPEAQDVLPIPEEKPAEETGAAAVEEAALEAPQVEAEEPSEQVAEAKAEETPSAEAEVPAEVETPESTATEQASQPED